MDTIANGHDSEWALSRLDTIPNEHHPEWTRSRMGLSQMDTIPNGHDPELHNPEWTRCRMSTYIVTEVLYTYAWQGLFKKKLLIKK